MKNKFSPSLRISTISSLAIAAIALSSPVLSQQAQSSAVERQAALSDFHSAKKCLELQSRIESTFNANEWCKEHSSNGDAPDKCSDSKRAARNDKISTLKKDQAACSADPDVLSKNYHAALEQAAAYSDPDAEICYVEGWPKLDAKDRNAYIKKSNVYIKRAIQRGDWRIAALLSMPVMGQNEGGAGMMVNLPIMGSHFTAYRFNRLLGYGATGQYADIVKYTAKSEAAFLTKKQLANANEWAKETYESYFTHSGKLASAPTPCLANTPSE